MIAFTMFITLPNFKIIIYKSSYISCPLNCISQMLKYPLVIFINTLKSQPLTQVEAHSL